MVFSSVRFIFRQDSRREAPLRKSADVCIHTKNYYSITGIDISRSKNHDRRCASADRKRKIAAGPERAAAPVPGKERRGAFWRQADRRPAGTKKTGGGPGKRRRSNHRQKDGNGTDPALIAAKKQRMEAAGTVQKGTESVPQIRGRPFRRGAGRRGRASGWEKRKRNVLSPSSLKNGERPERKRCLEPERRRMIRQGQTAALAKRERPGESPSPAVGAVRKERGLKKVRGGVDPAGPGRRKKGKKLLGSTRRRPGRPIQIKL